MTLRGFKSFASATTLNLEPGITCVVGPNGSGKSNVVDALAWVMGEQGAKSLRGGSMTDVIFAGTASRPPLGRAEVSLTIDNSDGALPIDYTEVAISRTLFRSGGSEYAINGTPCRLLDIQELLSDTGMGKQMHVIVGQGRLDAVLSATPEDRRGFIEEAAGVLKHRRRKEKALRKLETMSANLARVNDLATEIRRQLGPLARQADIARRAQVIQVEVRDARARLLADEISQLQAMVSAGQVDDRARQAKVHEIETHAQATRSRVAQLEETAAKAHPQLAHATDVWYQLSGLRERFRSLSQVAAERARGLGTTTVVDERRGSEPEVLEQRAQAAKAEETQIAGELEDAQKVLATAGEQRAQAEAKERAAEQELAAINRGIADRREGLARLTGQVGTRRSRLEAAEGELARLRQGHSEAQQRLADARVEFARLENEAIDSEEIEETLDAAHQEALAVHEKIEAQAEALIDELERAQAAADKASTRCEALSMALAAKDVTSEIMDADLPGIRGTLRDSMKITAGWEEAIAAALGQWTDAVIAEGSDAAIGALRHAKDADGQVSVLISSDEQKNSSPEKTPSGPQLPDGCRWASEEVSAGAGLTPAITHMLRGIALCPDLASAQKVVDTYAAAIRGGKGDARQWDLQWAVTAAGELISPLAAHRRGTSGPNVFALRAEIEEAEAAAQTARHEAEKARFTLAGMEDEREQAAAKVDETLAALHDSDAQLAATADRLGRLGQAMRSAEAEIERAAPQTARLEEEILAHQGELAELTARLEEAQREPAEAEAALEQAAAARDEAEKGARAARAAETDARLAVRTAEERLRAIKGRAASLFKAAQAEREARETAARRARRRAMQAERAAGVRDKAEAAALALDKAVARAADKRDVLEAARIEREAEISRTRELLESVTGELSRLTEAAHREEVARAEQNLRLENLCERAIEELGMSAEVLVEEFGPHLLIPFAGRVEEGEQTPEPVPFVRAEQEKRLKKAERELARLGKINPLALEEHAALNERHQFLTEQIEDIKSSQADLMELVKEIDDRVQTVFAESYEATAEKFTEVFARLFPGGEGKLVLTDPDDMLSTGIDIEARPAGKKVKRLSLLSGGERSLTAVALLVAIFMARPSPFYVMDEVEAALDDANLSRLLAIFRELQETSQLIVVTHQKRTMEIADALYGVTMGKDGVTKVVSQRLDKGEQ